MAFRRFTEGGSPTRASFLSSLTYRINPRFMLTCFFVLAFFLTLWTIYVTGTMHDVLQLVRAPFYGSQQGSQPPPPPPPPPPSELGDETPPASWVTPDAKDGNPPVPTGAASPPSANTGQRVIALVFYGRKELVEVLDCYLKRNLRENGGLLDEVIFAVKTDNEHDLQYLDELLPTSNAYKKHMPSGEQEWWNGSWEPVTEPDAIYIKIDDDVVFIEDSAIPALVKRLEENPQFFAVSANVVNNPALSWVHYSMGLYEPFWPELKKPTGKVSTSWKPSTIPSYEGKPEGPSGFKNGDKPAPFQGHRWLPIRTKPGETPYDITMSPASTLTYDAFGPSLHNWGAAAQTHYSFLTHLERNEVSRYHFDIWDYNYQRLSINFFALRGKDVMDVFPFPQRDDEEYLTTKRPKEIGRHVVVDGTGVAVHFAFNPQYSTHEGRGVAWTDALSRYKGYAEENICHKTYSKSTNPSESEMPSER